MMLDQPQLQSRQEYKNLGNHQPRHIHADRGHLRRDLCSSNIQQARPLIPNQHDRYQYECACAHLATGREKPAK